MKLTRRNEGTAYGVHAYGYDFHIVPSPKSGWLVTIRELTTTAGVTHSLGQPMVHSAHADSLKEIREILDEMAMIDDYMPMRWRLANGAVIGRHIDSMRAELFG